VTAGTGEALPGPVGCARNTGESGSYKRRGAVKWIGCWEGVGRGRTGQQPPPCQLPTRPPLELRSTSLAYACKVVRLQLSVLLPAYNEAENLAMLVPRIVAELEALGSSYEVVVVDDGSDDGTGDVLAKLSVEYPAVRGVRLRRNFGKSAALSEGLEQARGDVIVMMDADGQDEPAEIPRILQALEEGLDLVTGRRTIRQDRFVKRVTSRLYNTVTSWVTGVEGRDFNSGLKAMLRDVIEPSELYGELHRYIPILAHWKGYRVGELDVNHRPRAFGISKFGPARFWRGFLDLMTVKFLSAYTTRPFHLFGGLGLLLGLAGSGLIGWMGVLKLLGQPVGGRPALLVGVLFVVLSAQLLSLGLLGELIVHVRKSSEPSGSRKKR
jgi:glycosyltransferase involved in cell wall biosynthesis